MKILVTGGAGYIGSHTVRRLLEANYDVIVVDNLSKGHKESLPKGIKFFKIDIGDSKELSKILKDYKIDAVMHFAGFIEAEESMLKPDKYYKNNVEKSMLLMETMLKFNIKKLVFSSSAAVYGKPSSIPIKETAKLTPVNVYGKTKLIIEKKLASYGKKYGLKSASLRYFNAAGAGYDIGEDHRPESHLIPNIFNVILGNRKEIKIFGANYDTKDGTCIRDYVHVLDLADAHVLALNKLLTSGKSDVYNIGSEKGYSVKEIIRAVEKVAKKKVPVKAAKPRKGDTKILIADSSKIKKELGWKPKFGLNKIIETAWAWHKNNPDGFR